MEVQDITSTLAIVIPVYNEQEIISYVIKSWIEECRQLCDDFAIIAVNDGSKDNSLEILNQLSNIYKELIVCDQKNRGHGPAILTAYKNLNSKWIFQVDSDNEMSPKYFCKLWNQREQFDLLVAQRINRYQSVSRQIITRLSRFTIGVFFGRDVIDVNSPYRLYRVTAFKEEFNKIPSETFAPNLILSGCASYKNLRVKNIDIPVQPRQTGEVSIKKWRALRAAFKSWWQTLNFRMKYL